MSKTPRAIAPRHHATITHHVPGLHASAHEAKKPGAGRGHRADPQAPRPVHSSETCRRLVDTLETGSASQRSRAAWHSNGNGNANSNSNPIADLVANRSMLLGVGLQCPNARATNDQPDAGQGSASCSDFNPMCDPTGLMLGSPNLAMARQALEMAADEVLALRDGGGANRGDVEIRHLPTVGNDIELLVDGDQSIMHGLFPLISAATQSVHIMMYQFQHGLLSTSVLSLLAEKAAAGVDVYLLIDSQGCNYPWHPQLHQSLAELQSLGGEHVHVCVSPFVGNGRLHHKAVVVDSEVALVGSTNIVDWSVYSQDYQDEVWRALASGDCTDLFEEKEEGRFSPAVRPSDRRSPDPSQRAIHDVMFAVRGPAVQQLQVSFALNWLQRDQTFYPELSQEALRERLLAPAGQRQGDNAAAHSNGSGGANAPAPPPPPAVQASKFDLFKRSRSRQARVQVLHGSGTSGPTWLAAALSLVRHAKKTLFLEAAYVTSPQVRQELISAANRGVRVTLIVPGASDHPWVTTPAMRNAYPELLSVGVKIREYRGFNHSKVLLVDDEFVLVGSADYMAFPGFYESALAIRDRGIARQVRRAVFDRDSLPCQSVAIRRGFQPGWFDTVVGRPARWVLDKLSQEVTVPHPHVHLRTRGKKHRIRTSR